MKRANITTPIASMAKSIIRKSPLGLSRGICPPSTHGRQATERRWRKIDLDREDRNTSHQGSRAPIGPPHKEAIGFRRRQRHPGLCRAGAGEAEGHISDGPFEHWRDFSVLVRLGPPSRPPNLQARNGLRDSRLPSRTLAVFREGDADFQLARLRRVRDLLPKMPRSIGRPYPFAARPEWIAYGPIRMIEERRSDDRRHRPQSTVPSMRRPFPMLAFAACVIQAAGCSAIRGAGESPGPVLCDPPALASPHLWGLASGALEGGEIYPPASPGLGPRKITATWRA